MGLEFIVLACAPRQLARMRSENYETLRNLMDRALDYVVGEAPPIKGNRSKFQTSQYTLFDIHENESYGDNLYGSQYNKYGAHKSGLYTASPHHSHFSRTPQLHTSLSYDASVSTPYSTPKHFSRTLSGGLAIFSSGNEGVRLASIQEQIRLLELVRERK